MVGQVRETQPSVGQPALHTGTTNVHSRTRALCQQSGPRHSYIPGFVGKVVSTADDSAIPHDDTPAVQGTVSVALWPGAPERCQDCVFLISSNSPLRASRLTPPAPPYIPTPSGPAQEQGFVVCAGGPGRHASSGRSALPQSLLSDLHKSLAHEIHLLL